MTKHSFEIATADSRLAKKWKNRKFTWEELVEKCKETTRTQETVAEYKSMSKDEQGIIKDVGGFVGGYLKEGRRKNGHVAFRTLATLDIDNGTTPARNIWDDFTRQYNCNALMYSTHKHTPEKPRLRLVIPFSRRVTCEEYEPVCRRIAASLGIDLFDGTTYQLTRLFYWPSTSDDGEFFFESECGKEPLNPDDLLEEYTDWKDCSEWPSGSRESDVRRHEMKKAEDPTEKKGVIGAFCRSYSIEEAIEKFLPDVYEPTATEGRYTYVNGSVAGGLVCYDHLFAYSNHETDPASKQLCNAFDLVRIHKFGEMDEGSRADDVTKLPSYERMMEFAGADKEVKRLIVKERKESATKDFAGIEEDSKDDSWTDQLDTDKRGIKSTASNAFVVLENDPALKGKLRYDEFRDRPEIVGRLPWDRKSAESYVRRWTDADDASLRIYMEKTYGITGKDKIKDAKVKCFEEHKYHPVRDYLNGLEWDRTPRLDRAVIDYIGADDNELTRAATKTWMVAAVARIFEPGCKMDYCLILVGAQGVGKSTFFEVMGGEWYNGNLSAMSSDRQSLEQLRGSWIFELQELDGMKKREVSSVKAFITNRTDKYRGAYKENTDEFPRQCVFGGTTNEDTFLKDDTGERRFWPVQVSRERQKMGNPRKALMRDRDQLWAEAVDSYRHGCRLCLSAGLEIEMENRRKSYSWTEEDPMPGYVEEYLETKLPVDWDSYTTEGKVYYYKHEDEIRTKGIQCRMTAFPGEFITCYLGKDRACKEYQSVSAKFNRIMKNEHSIEWTQKMIPYQGRGFKSSRQKGWLRNEAPREDDPL